MITRKKYNHKLNQLDLYSFTGLRSYVFGLRSSVSPLKIILLITLHLCFDNISAQKEVRFSKLTRNDGLSHNNVDAIFQDKYGFLWFGTKNGLNRYDGYELKPFRHQVYDNNTAASSSFCKIVGDENGNLWFGTKRGLDCYDPINHKFTHFTADSKSKNRLSSNNISSIATDKKGNVWVATLEGGLNKINIKNSSCKHYMHNLKNTNSIASNDVYDIQVDDKNNLWIGTGNSLDYLDVETNTFTHFTIGYEGYDEHKHLIIKALLLDSQEILWIGTSSGLFTLDVSLGLFTPYKSDVLNPNSIADNNINTLLEDSNNDIWIGTENGLSHFSKSTQLFTNYLYNPNNPSSISNNRIISLYEDRSKILWIGTKGGGINKLDLKRKAFYNWHISKNKSYVLFNPNITSIARDSAGKIYLGTSGSGISVCEIKTKNHKCNDVELFNTSKYIPDNQIRSICYHRGTLWVGMNTGGLTAINYKNGKYSVKNFKNTGDSTGISNNQVNAIISDKNGCLWIATRNGLNKMMCTVDKSEVYFITYKHSFGQKNTISDNNITSLLQDREGNIWLGTYDKGIDKIDINTQKITHYEHVPNSNNSLSSNRINCITEDHLGRIWIATVDRGLDVFNPGNNVFAHYNTHSVIASNEIMSMIKDLNNNLWISTSKGIVKLDIKTEKFDMYDISDGIINDGFNKNAAYIDESGWLYFGTNSGLVYFDPKKIQANNIKPDIVITNFTTLSDKKWTKKDIFVSKYNSENSTIELEHDENIFAIEFAALDYTNPEKNIYQYKIDEIHKDWIDYGKQRKITVTSLSSGDYTLRIRGSNNDEIFNKKGVSLKIKIKPAFIETNIFYAIISIIVIILSVWVYSYLVEMRTNKILAEKNQELEHANIKLLESEQNLKSLNQSKDKFFSIIAHDLRNPFSPLISLTELLDDEYQMLEDTERKDYIREIRHGAKRLHDLLENLLHWSLSQTKRIKYRPEILDLDDLISINIDLLAISAEKKEINLIKNFDGDHSVYADEDMLNLVVRNLLNNAIKFSHEKSEIFVNLEESENFYTVEIKDSGIGITPNDAENIFKGLQKDKVKKKGSGSGLGLILCKEFVEKNGGEIWVKSQLDKGSSFFFTVRRYG